MLLLIDISGEFLGATVDPNKPVCYIPIFLFLILSHYPARLNGLGLKFDDPEAGPH